MAFSVRLKTSKLGQIRRPQQQSPKAEKITGVYYKPVVDWDVFQNRYAVDGKVDALYKAVTKQNFKVGRVFGNIKKTF